MWLEVPPFATRVITRPYADATAFVRITRDTADKQMWQAAPSRNQSNGRRTTKRG